MTMVHDITSTLTRVAALTVLLVTGLAIARAETPGHHTASSGNQLWLVDTRQAPSHNATAEQAGRLKYWEFNSDHQWREAILPELLSTDDPATTTLFYVHENRVSRSQSFQRANTVFANLSQCFPEGHSFRMIAVSWPSDRVGRLPRPDAQAKAKRSEVHGLYLAWLVDQIDPDIPVGMFGSSFGPRLITAALHHLGGGSIDGRCLTARTHPTRRPVRVALAAAALDAHWLHPGQRYGQAMTQIEHALVLVNPRDKVLRWYPRLYGHRGPNALGYVGLGSRCGSLSHPDRVVEHDVSCQIGSTHGWCAYEGSSSMIARMVTNLVH
jgi:hypothetical protein